MSNPAGAFQDNKHCRASVEDPFSRKRGGPFGRVKLAKFREESGQKDKAFCTQLRNRSVKRTLKRADRWGIGGKRALASRLQFAVITLVSPWPPALITLSP